MSIFFAAAATQGFLLAVILGIHRKNILANRILAIWIALLSVDLLQQIYYLDAYYQTHPQFILLINLLPLTYGGFLFLYVRSFLTDQALRKKDSLHFIFFFVGLIVQIPLILLPAHEKLQLIEQAIAGNMDWQMRIFSLLLPLIASVYAILSYRLLQQYSNAKHKSLTWLSFMLKLNIVIWLVVWLSILIPQENRIITTQIIYLLVGLVIYSLGYFSLRQPNIFIEGNYSFKQPTPKYGENRLPDNLRESIWQELDAYMRANEPWRAANLTLIQLANDAGISSHHISQVLNDHLGLSFNDYVNQYRVNGVCAELINKDRTLLDIAMDCGFSSKSSFNAIFKKHTGKTPSDYRKSI